MFSVILGLGRRGKRGRGGKGRRKMLRTSRKITLFFTLGVQTCACGHTQERQEHYAKLQANVRYICLHLYELFFSFASAVLS